MQHYYSALDLERTAWYHDHSMLSMILRFLMGLFAY